jgi:hypothetical protein
MTAALGMNPQIHDLPGKAKSRYRDHVAAFKPT